MKTDQADLMPGGAAGGSRFSWNRALAALYLLTTVLGLYWAQRADGADAS